MKDDDATVRAQAARQLGTRRAKEAVEPLLALLKDEDAVLEALKDNVGGAKREKT